VAALGGETEVPTLEGKARLRVPAGTQPGSTLRLRGKGIPRKGSGRGDLRVEVAIEAPTRLTERQRELLQQFAGELGPSRSVSSPGPLRSQPPAGPPPRKSLMGRLREMLS
jgi:molecular chaperone DnaJ